MNLLQITVAALIGYLFGCIQTAYIIGRIVKKIDIRQHGSNNAGASNITIVMGWKFGVITAIVDVLKATIAVILIKNLFPYSQVLLFVAGAFAILGHIFPFYLKFKGGKGAASVVGMILAIDLKIAVLMIAAILIITIIFDYIALGTIAMFFILPASTYYFNYNIFCTILGVFLAVLCLYKHHINIVRILKKEEEGLRKVLVKHKKY